jgi:hypothetical protein
MKFSSLFAPLALLSAVTTLQAQTAPYLETAPLSFLRAFAITTVSSTTKGPLPIPPGTSVPLDPDKLRPDHRITTDIGIPLYYSEESGEQSFWVRQSQRAVLERIAMQQQKRLHILLANEIAEIRSLEDLVEVIKTDLANATDAGEQTALKTQLNSTEQRLGFLKEQLVKQTKALFGSDAQLFTLEAQLTYAEDEFDDQGNRWELLAVREPQRSVEAAGRTPYKIFLGRVDRIRRMITRTYDSGLRIQPYFSLGATTETLVNDGVTRATGTGCTTVFEVLFDRDLDSATPLTEINFQFAADPLHRVANESLPLAEAGVDYNTNLVRWVSFGSGYMTYGIRSTPGPLAAVLPVNIRITGHGSWGRGAESITDGVTTYTDSHGGVTPFAIKVGDVKFQHRNLFPDFELGADL